MLNRVSNNLIDYFPESNRFERIWKLAQVDFKKRFYNNKLGLFWALLNPLFQVSIYSLVFTYLMPRVSEDIPNFALFIFCIIVFWMEFVQITKRSMKVMYSKRYLIENINVNKLDLFYSTTVSSILSLAFNVSAFMLFALLAGQLSLSNFAMMQVLVVTYLLLATGIGMILGWVYIYLRDLEHLYDIIVMLGFWTSGVFFDATPIIAKYPFISIINPFIGLHINLRYCLLGIGEFKWDILTFNVLIALILFTLGQLLIKRYSFEVLENI